MQRTFPFQDLDDSEFETLVASICQRILGTGTIVFATGKDGGRDATFNGVAQNFPSCSSPLGGKFVIQSKHTNNPVASCSDAEFDRIIRKETPRIQKLIADGELEHYLIFTNRKKPAINTVKKEKALRKLGMKTAHILGIEQLHSWLTHAPQIWSDLGFDRFETHFKIQVSDLTAVIGAFHEAMMSGSV